MMSTNNVLSPASVHPIVSPSQDMVIGLYYLTECKSDLKDEEVIESSRAFSDVDEAELAYDNGEITLQTPIRIRLGSLAGDSDLHKELLNRFSDLLTDKPVHPKELVCTTLGRVYFNSILPSNFPYVQEIVRKTQMRKLISEVIERYNKAEVRIFLDSMKDVGFKFGTKAGLTVAINDVKTPPKKDSILKKVFVS